MNFYVIKIQNFCDRAKPWLGKVEALFHAIHPLLLGYEKRACRNFDTPSFSLLWQLYHISQSGLLKGRLTIGIGKEGEINRHDKICDHRLSYYGPDESIFLTIIPPEIFCIGWDRHQMTNVLILDFVSVVPMIFRKFVSKDGKS